MAHNPAVGIDVAASKDYTPHQTAIQGNAVMSYIKSLHVTSAGIVWNLCSPGKQSDHVNRCPESLSPPRVRQLITVAQTYGLKVQLRPIIRVGPPSGWNIPSQSWEGHIVPPDPKSWFASLYHAERPYLMSLSGIKGAQFVVGTELAGLAGDPGWGAYLAKAQKLCGCEVSIDSWHGYLQGTRKPGTPIGVDWYPHLRLPSGASQKRVSAAWEASMAGIPPQVRQRISIDELSISATDGAYRHPSDWNTPGILDRKVQVRYFTAACQAVRDYHMAGIWFYEIPLDQDLSGPSSFPPFFARTAGAQAISRCADLLGGQP